MLRAGERVASDTDDERLAKADTGRLRDGLIRKSTGTRNDACEGVGCYTRRGATGLQDLPMRPALWIAPGWMPILQPSGLMIPGQLGPTRRDLDWLLSAFMT